MVCSPLHTQGSNFRFSRKVNGRSLSPLARGTRKMSGIVERNKRFIPACAGNSTVKASKVSIVAVHPRLRGELYDWAYFFRRRRGSSPLARGTRTSRNAWRYAFTVHPRLRGELFIRWIVMIEIARFIPACAGNSLKQGIDHFSNFSKDFQLRKWVQMSSKNLR